MKIRIKFRTFILLLILTTAGFTENAMQSPPQLDSIKTFVISQIKIEGNRSTKPFVILKEMQTRPGDAVTLAKLESDRKRIESLGIFNYVQMELIPENTTVKLIVSVTEQWYIYPYPVIKQIEKSWEKFAFGGGLKYKNFRGRNERLQMEGHWGYRDRLNFQYTVPWLFHKRNISAAFGALWENRKGNSVAADNFRVEQFTTSATIGRRFGYHTYFSVGGGYSAINIDPEKKLTRSPDGKDRFPLLETTFTYDTRDYVYYPHKGMYFKTYITKYGYHGNDINYSQYGLDLRKYIPLTKNLLLAGRAAVDRSRGAVPVYNRFFLGYNYRLRGHYDDHHEGENRIMAGAEFRFPILPVDHYSLYQDTPFAYLFKNLKFGIGGAFFYDTGTVWSQADPLQEQTLLHGFGFGLNFHVPYLEIVRLEYAFDTDFNGEVILFDVEMAL